MANDTKQILIGLKDIKSELDYIKEHMVDSDSVLTIADAQAIVDAEKDLKEGKTTTLENLKKELKL